MKYLAGFVVTIVILIAFPAVFAATISFWVFIGGLVIAYFLLTSLVKWSFKSSAKSLNKIVGNGSDENNPGI